MCVFLLSLATGDTTSINYPAQGTLATQPIPITQRGQRIISQPAGRSESKKEEKGTWAHYYKKRPTRFLQGKITHVPV